MTFSALPFQSVTTTERILPNDAHCCQVPLTGSLTTLNLHDKDAFSTKTPYYFMLFLQFVFASLVEIEKPKRETLECVAL